MTTIEITALNLLVGDVIDGDPAFTIAAVDHSGEYGDIEVTYIDGDVDSLNGGALFTVERAAREGHEYAQVPATQVAVGDVMVGWTGKGNLYRLPVEDVDTTSNRFGQVILRSGGTSTVRNPEALVIIERAA